MQPPPPDRSHALHRALSLLAAIAADAGANSIAAIARAQNLPLSTAHRMIAGMEAAGWLVRIGRGRYRAGLAAARLAAHADPRATAIAAARPLLRQLVRATGRTAHLGILEADMVTYLVKEAPARAQMFSQEAMQLEAYCSAIGKVLLARLPAAARDAYLAQDSFVPLTPHTIIQPDALRRHLIQVAAQGFALDQQEIAPGLFCVAVPIAEIPGLPPLAISAAGAPPAPDTQATLLETLRSLATGLARRLEGQGRCPWPSSP